jgi:hypothetical protein
VALILGIDTALGRAAAQQLSRAGCRVVLAGRDDMRLDSIADQIAKKGGEPAIQSLSEVPSDWYDSILDARDTVGHLHFVLNAMAFDHEEGEAIEDSCKRAQQADGYAAELLFEHGPTKVLTLWPEEIAVPPPIRPDVWHGYVVLGPRQRMDTPAPAELDKSGLYHLRASGVADSVVFLFQLPPSARPGRVYLTGIQVADRKGEA